MATVTVDVPRSERLSLAQVARHTAIGAIVLLAILLPAGAIYQWIGQSLDAQRFPQQGHNVALGAVFPGVSLNINCTGQGSPVVVLEAGAGVPAVSWSLVQPGIAQFTRVCSYDRAGYGWSDPGPMPRSSVEIAKELHALLAARARSRRTSWWRFPLAGSTLASFSTSIRRKLQAWCWSIPRTKTR